MSASTPQPASQSPSHQGTKQVLVLSTRPSHQVLAGINRHIGDCQVQHQALDLTTLDRHTLRVVAAAAIGYHRVVTDESKQAALLRLALAPLTQLLVVMTDKNPADLLLPAMNLNTGGANFTGWPAT